MSKFKTIFCYSRVFYGMILSSLVEYAHFSFRTSIVGEGYYSERKWHLLQSPQVTDAYQCSRRDYLQESVTVYPMECFHQVVHGILFGLMPNDLVLENQYLATTKAAAKYCHYWMNCLDINLNLKFYFESYYNIIIKNFNSH